MAVEALKVALGGQGSVKRGENNNPTQPRRRGQDNGIGKRPRGGGGVLKERFRLSWVSQIQADERMLAMLGLCFVIAGCAL